MLLSLVDLMHTSLFVHFGHFGPFGHFGYFGPFAGRFSPLFLFFGALIVFAILRRGLGWNRYYHRGGRYYGPYNRPQPPTQGPAGDVRSNPPDQGGYNPYGPYAGQPGDQQGQYGQYNPYAGEQGANTIRVDANSGQQTVRVDSPYTGQGANTVRVDTPTTGTGQPTTPLRAQPPVPGWDSEPGRARVEQPGDDTDA